MMWNKVTWYSQLLAIILAIAIFGIGFNIGRRYEQVHYRDLKPIKGYGDVNQQNSDTSYSSLGSATSDNRFFLVDDSTYYCDAHKTIKALIYNNSSFKEEARLTLSDGRNMTLPQVLSASGIRYANADESFVFWNKGITAFITEGKTITYNHCSSKPVVE